jgi:hypothetical protein
MEFVKFPEIGQFRNAAYYVKSDAQYVRQDENDNPVYDEDAPLPTLQARGTTKIHGTNAAACFDPRSQEFWFQSRSQIIGPNNDNCGFVATYGNRELGFLFDAIPHSDNEIVSVFGEWAGKNIQKGVAISEIPKTFFVFAVKVGERWLSNSFHSYARLTFPEHRIYDIRDFGTYEVYIDFEAPQMALDRMEALTKSVEAQCPVARHFGVEGTGEGIVWRLQDIDKNPNFWFKTKGEEHKVTKTKELIPADIERQESIEAFISATVTEARCQQAISILRQGNVPVDRKALGWFIKWVHDDIIKEESDTLETSGIAVKDIGKPIADTARKWFFQNENAFALEF